MVKVEFNSTKKLPQIYTIPTENRHENESKNNWFQTRTTTKIPIAIAILICVGISITCLTSLLVANVRASNTTTEESNTEFEYLDLTNLDSTYKDRDFTDRQQWNSEIEENVLSINLPVPYVIIHDTVTEKMLFACNNQIIFNRMWSSAEFSTGYNFLICGDNGYVIEDRGWTKEGTHAEYYNALSIGIAFVGSFEDTLPSNAALVAAQVLLQIGVEANYIKEDYNLFGIRQLFERNSPGQALYELIKTWPHWTSE